MLAPATVTAGTQLEPPSGRLRRREEHRCVVVVVVFAVAATANADADAPHPSPFSVHRGGFARSRRQRHREEKEALPSLYETQEDKESSWLSPQMREEGEKESNCSFFFPRLAFCETPGDSIRFSTQKSIV